LAAPDEGTLDGIGLLHSLTDEERRAIAQRCAWRRFKGGEQIFDRDSETQDVLFITDGEVRVVNYSASGRETAFGQVSAGGHVGEIAAIDGMTRSASVVAVTACTIASFPREQFVDLVESHAPIAIHLLRRFTDIIRTNNERIAELSTIGAVQRVYRELLRLCVQDPSGKGAVVTPLPTQHDLASKVGATRETVARALGQLMNTGVIERRGRTLLIRDTDMLSFLANPDGDGVSGIKDAG
jgi:CRP/FNR family transcriptional regulator, cyclic AMP receptor protein